MQTRRQKPYRRGCHRPCSFGQDKKYAPSGAMTGLFLAGRWHSKNPLRQIIYHLVVSQRRFVTLDFRFCFPNYSSH
jgi:hypothetical protein